VTHSLKPPGFNPCTYTVKTWFQTLLFQMQLVPVRIEAHEPVLAAAYALFENLSADPTGPAEALFASRDSVNVITEHMQMCRDRPELVVGRYKLHPVYI
jgi:hypothetical protein